MNAMLKRVVLLLLLVAVGSVGFHCGTDTKFVVSDLDGSTGPKDTSQPGVDTSGGFWRVLVPSPAEYFARVQQVVKLKAIVVNSAGEHDANVTVSFKITSDNPGGASFIVGDIDTNADGEAVADFRTGTAPAVYTVEVSVEGAASPITLTVNVADAPTGNLEVALKYDAPVQLAKIKLILLEGNYICNNLVPTQPPTDVLADQTALSTSDKTKFNNLAVGVNFTVFATGFRADNQLVAAGCLDGLFVQEGETTKVTLTLYILSLDVVGVYDMIGHFNFVNAIPGKLGDVIKQIVLAVEDPGQFLIDLAQTVLQQWLGILGTALNVVIDLVEDYISDWLTNQIQNIGFLKPVFDALSQITNLITNLEIEYTLSFSKLSNDFLVRGTEIWHTINFWWKFGCDKNAPDYDTCGTKFSLSMNALQSPDLAYPLDIIKGEFVGSIVNFDQLNIERHTINLHYGKLIVYVINNILLPKITGDPSITSLSALVKSLIDCDKFAEDVAGSVSGIPFFGDISEGALKSLCTAGEGLLSFLGTLLTSFVDQLALDTRLRVQGTCTLVDTDNDLLVDKIINGTYDGNIEYEGSQGNNFSGTFSGDRKTAP